MKKRRTLLFLLLLLGAVYGALQVIPASAFTSTQTISTTADESVGMGNNPRFVELERVLGIPRSELEKMSAQEVNNLIRENADKLGVVAYENTWDYLGREIPKIVAGSRVYKPENFSASEP